MHRETLVGEARINGLPVVEPLTKKADIYRPVFESLSVIEPKEEGSVQK